ncbi:hypothetical protein GGF44_004219, partial [Coemansia sp. RSA 1694]
DRALAKDVEGNQLKRQERGRSKNRIKARELLTSTFIGSNNDNNNSNSNNNDDVALDL